MKTFLRYHASTTIIFCSFVLFFAMGALMIPDFNFSWGSFLIGSFASIISAEATNAFFDVCHKDI